MFQSDASNSQTESSCQSNPLPAAEGPSSSNKPSNKLRPNYTLKLTLPGHLGVGTLAKFSPDGKWLASCNSSGNFLKIWGAYDGILDKCIVTGHRSGMNDVAWSNDSEFLVTAGIDTTLKIWQLSNGRCWKTLKGHSAFVFRCNFCPLSSRILSGSGDKSIKIWDMSTGKCLGTVSPDHGPITSVTYYRDGKRFISSSLDGFFLIWDAVSYRCILSHKHDDGISFIKLSPNYRYILIAYITSKIALMDNLEKTSCENTFTGHTNKRFNLFLSFSMIGGNWIVSGSEDNLIYIWDLESREVVQKLSGHTDTVMCVDCHPKEKIIASCALEEGRIKLWKSDSHLSDFFDFMPFPV